jgi:exosortase A-associated hydrolase 2
LQSIDRVGCIRPFFLPIGRDQRFCLLHSPSGESVRNGSILYVHPFAEEVNKSRRMAAVQARAFAKTGWTVLQMDLLGCGDSSGDFGDARWQRWVDDVLEAAAWLRRETGHQPVLWGLRTGCLLAVHAMRRLEAAHGLILWQPVLSGKQFLQQFLRLKVANQMLGSTEGDRIGTQQLRKQLADGDPVEVAGYTLSSELALGMETAELDLPDQRRRVAWLEIGASSGDELSPASRIRVQAWRDAGHHIEAHRVEGPAFWQTQEISECPALIEATLSIVTGWRE